MSKRLFTNWMAAAMLAIVLLALAALGNEAAAQEGIPSGDGDGGAGGSAPTIPTETDNNTPGTATFLGCGVPVQREISSPGELDWYGIRTDPDKSIVVSIEGVTLGSSIDAVLTLYDKNGTTVLTDQDQFNGNDPRLHWTTSFNDPDRPGSLHYVRVHDFNGRGGANYHYQIKWEYARYVSMTTAGTVDGISYAPGDILTYSGCDNPMWRMFFDASDVGINGNIRDFAVLNGNPAGPWRHGAIIMAMPKQKIPGFGTLVAHDLVLFQPEIIGHNTYGEFYRFFDGSDVGLTLAGEAIDGLAMVNSHLLLSTTAAVSTISPVVAATDEDALLFSPTTLGTTTAGSWTFFFDASDVGVPANADLKSFWLSPSATYLLATFDKALILGGTSRGPTQATACDPGFYGTTTNCAWGVAGQGLYDPDLVFSPAVLDGYDEGSHWWPNGFTVPSSASTGAMR